VAAEVCGSPFGATVPSSTVGVWGSEFCILNSVFCSLIPIYVNCEPCTPIAIASEIFFFDRKISRS